MRSVGSLLSLASVYWLSSLWGVKVVLPLARVRAIRPVAVVARVVVRAVRGLRARVVLLARVCAGFLLGQVSRAGSALASVARVALVARVRSLVRSASLCRLLGRVAYSVASVLSLVSPLFVDAAALLVQVAVRRVGRFTLLVQVAVRDQGGATARVGVLDRVAVVARVVVCAVRGLRARAVLLAHVTGVLLTQVSCVRSVLASVARVALLARVAY